MVDEPAVVTWRERSSSGELHEKVATWRSESGLPPPSRESIATADDRTTADAAMRLLRQGKFLLYTGDFVNARQLLSALGRRLAKRGRVNPAAARSPAEIFRQERDLRAEEHRVLTRLLVPLDAEYRVALRRGIELRAACEPVWGPPPSSSFSSSSSEVTALTVAPLRELLGMQGAAQWREKGIEIPGLPGRLHPHYGVFTPTRGEYPELLALAPAPTGKRVFDLGTGTGVLGFLMLARDAREVVATDVAPRAVACARDNAERLGFADRFTVYEADLFPPVKEAKADLIVCNPPWLPLQPRTLIDRAVYDAEGLFLKRLLEGARSHLTPGGECWIILSDLAERIGLRAAGEFEAMVRDAGLAVKWTREVQPKHKRSSDPDDPLHAARSSEIVRLWCVA